MLTTTIAQVYLPDVYTVKVGSSLYVLHAFMKKSTRGIRTPKKEVDLIKRRLRRAQEMDQEEEKANHA